MKIALNSPKISIPIYCPFPNAFIAHISMLRKTLISYNSFHSAKKNKNSVRSQFTSINPYYSDGCIFIYRILAQANKKQIIRIFFSFGWELSQLRTEEAWKMENCSCSRICICWSLLWFFCISCVISYRIPTVVVRSYFE